MAKKKNTDTDVKNPYKFGLGAGTQTNSIERNSYESLINGIVDPNRSVMPSDSAPTLFPGFKFPNNTYTPGTEPVLPDWANAASSADKPIGASPQVVEPTLPEWATKKTPEDPNSINKDVLDNIINNGVLMDWNTPKSEPEAPAEAVSPESEGWRNLMAKYMNDYNNAEFNFDLNGEELYHQYRDQYMRNGSLASKDAMGQAAGLTGGYGSSYAQAVGNQAYQGYLSQLNNVVPEIYQQSYNRFSDEQNRKLKQYQLAQDQFNDAYNREAAIAKAQSDAEQEQWDRWYKEAQLEADKQYNADKLAADKESKDADREADRAAALDKLYAQYGGGIANGRYYNAEDWDKYQRTATDGEKSNPYVFDENIADATTGRTWDELLDMAKGIAMARSGEDFTNGPTVLDNINLIYGWKNLTENEKAAIEEMVNELMM